MGISGISSTSSSYAANDDPLSLKKAIKAYQDERLTGLTDEEREEIERLAKEYLEKRPIKTKQDLDAFNDYVKSLMKKFGFKGDLDEYAVAMAGELQDKLRNSIEPPSLANISEHFQRAVMGAMVVKNKKLSSKNIN